MRIIDSKGRLFGKINIIDFFLLVFVLLIIILGMKFLKPKEKVEISLQMELSNQSAYIAKNINVGDIILEDDEKAGEITGLTFLPASGTNKNIIISLKLFADSKNNKLFFNNQMLKIGNELSIELKDVIIEGVILHISKKEEREFAKKRVTVKMYNQSSWIADLLRIGDSELSGGKEIAKIIDKDVEPAEMIVISQDGEVFLREHPTNKDITLTLEVVAEKVGGSYFFHGSELKAGNNLMLETSSINVNGVIVGVE